MLILLDRKAFETALPHVSMAAVAPMVAAHVAGEPPLHKRAQGVRGRGLQHEMKMVGHEAEAKDFDRVAGFRVREQAEEGAIVPIFVKDSRAPVASIEDMVDVAADLSTRDTRHH